MRTRSGKVADFLAVVHKAHHIHIHDNNGMSDEHLALGEGTIPWSECRKKQLLHDYHGVVVIEGKSIDQAKKSLAVFRRYFL